MFICGICVVAVAACLLALSFSLNSKSERAGMRWFAAIAFGVGILCSTLAGITTVSAGSVGIVSLFGRVDDETLSPGLHLVNPLSKVHEMSIRTENYWMSHDEQEGTGQRDDSVKVRSSDGLQMPIDFSVPYRLAPEAAPWVFKNLGPDYIEKLLRPALSTGARRAGSKYVAEELYSSKRDEFSANVQELLEAELNELLRDGYAGKNPPANVLIISQVLVGHVGIPDMVKSAIESKLKADQEQQAMEFTIMKATKEAERKRIEAGGIQAFQEIVSKGIDDRLLRWKAIDATLQLAESPNAKVIFIGNGEGSLPVLLSGAAGTK